MVSKSSHIFGVDASGLYMTPVMLDDIRDVEHVACSAGITTALDQEGRVFCLGINSFGQCALPATTRHVYLPSPVQLPRCRSVDAGFQHCAAVSREGVVYTWGKGKRGQLGNGKTDDFSFTPVHVNIPEEVVAVSAGFNHTAALSDQGTVYLWGKHMSLTKKENQIGEVSAYDSSFVNLLTQWSCTRTSWSPGSLPCRRTIAQWRFAAGKIG